MKKVTVLISTLLVGILAFTACGQTNSSTNSSASNAASSTQKPKEISIGYQPGINHTLLIVAKNQEWFEEEFKKDNIKVNFQSFVSGPPMMEAFAGGRLDFGQAGDQPSIQARANNADIKGIGVYASGYKLNTILAATGSNIKSAKDLKGKKVAVTVGSSAHMLLARYLEAAGLKQSDIQLVNLQPTDIKTSFASKNIDAAITWEPYASSIEAENTAYAIGDGTGLKYEVNLISVNNEFAKNNPDIVKRVLKVYEKTEKWVKANPDKTADIISKELKLNRDVAAKGLAKEDFDIRLTDQVVDSLTSTIKTLRQNNTVRKDVDVKDLLDKTYATDAGIK
ncbi:putative aliphatic sulfonates-binding protein [Clostridium pasteurianum DSM 525 = ATCC 6013]|uniref:Putative aliphatic sulfonates-binding protein n=1 Tax=Clostridium pasteurianum DSM 525 = ATCC 6013 TaxID=1262449 RepID=A0A0H3J7L9_CLOPA|nr:aliphatic sulfonate ABC transporter substrate-binding protein [Clostridium pasteurianum]AJA49187.1 putative aliphatic sulfonates-binding protein [Clostridium pasteurianum DSM 525 = ATCC 6013]AJA53175.1 putative aliphatic sulfonates-binding protein [Clostridium pasteurianum DSM 525 = ATCC 6013]AOZ76370.1 aliphatic sulfonate ABC transporter substrate-binding protein [Clostridium pasteurianum DSM 525 = ATCC 6013]AOZ80167.1 aliphatic sulfonate ABC transporter substrate-binding protein [Clostridi